MTLRAFNNVNTETKTNYIVFRDGEPIDQFMVDYISADLTTLRLTHWIKQGAKVKHVSINSATGLLEVECFVK